MNELETYLDNAATTQPYPEVIDAVRAAMESGWGNASALHERGKGARETVEESRHVVAEALGVDAREVFFTSGGTESNNLAITGACRAVRAQRDGIVTSTVEHASVTKTVRGLKREGWHVDYVGARCGLYDLDALAGFLSERTALITVMRVQNEVGFILPVDEIVQLRNTYAPRALVHTDAVQAFGKIEFKPRELGVDLASMSSHKIGGPQGIGALYVKAGTPMFTTAFGGGQERGLRSGTEAVPLIAGFAQAVRITLGRRVQAQVHAQALKDQLLAGVQALRPDVVVNSRDDGSPYIVSFSLPGVNNTEALTYLSKRGVYVSKASACEELHAAIPRDQWRPKHPLPLQLAGVPHALVPATFRVSFSQLSTTEQVERFLHELGAYLAQTG